MQAAKKKQIAVRMQYLDACQNGLGVRRDLHSNSIVKAGGQAFK